MEDVFLSLIQSVGVPTAIAFYVLIKVNHNLEQLTKSVDKLTYELRESRK